MSTATKLSDLPLVTSLDSTDTVIATDATGAGKRISKTNLRMNRVFFNTISSPTWVRVAQVNSAGWALMKIFNAWLNVPGNNILLDMQLHPNSESYNHVTVLSRTANSPNSMFQKIRVVRQKGSAYYIDIYYNASTAEQVYVYLIESLNVTLLTPEQNAEIPEGYTAIEFDITKAAWGGVKRYAPISYKLQQKGGQPDVKSNPLNQRPPERRDDRRNGSSHLLYGLQHLRNCRELWSGAGTDAELSSRINRSGIIWHAQSRMFQSLWDSNILYEGQPHGNNGSFIYSKRRFRERFPELGQGADILGNLTCGKEVAI